MVIAPTVKGCFLNSEKGANVSGQTHDNSHCVIFKFRIKTLMENISASEGKAQK